jgi:tetratricopeptide (TPR) repeat protein
VHAALLLGLGGLTRPAAAGDATTPDHEATEAKSAGPDSEAARAHALALSEQASLLYDRGDFTAAIGLLESAYAEFPEPVLLYDLGRAHEGLGDDQAAIAAYEGYLAARSDQKNRGGIERRLQTLRLRVDATRRHAAELAAKSAPPAPRSTTVPTAVPRSGEQPSTLRQAAPWIVTGVGALTLAGGGVLWLLALDRHELAQAETDLASAERHQSEATKLARAATVTSVAGGILTAAGATWAIITLTTSRPKAKDTTRLGLSVGPGSVALSSRF